MKNKIRFFIAALTAAFYFCAFPVAAYTGGDKETPEETAVIEVQEETTGEDERNPFTPNGTGTVLNSATDGNGKQFYTITTPADNIFYLIIDLERESDNVYFLDAVTEKDLLALAEQSADKVPGEIAASGTDTQMPIVSDPVVDDTVGTGDTQKDTGFDSDGGPGSLVFILIAALMAGCVGYYFKIYKPKQQTGIDDEFDEEYEDEDADEDVFGEYDGSEEKDEANGSYPLEEEDISFNSNSDNDE